jgi:ankyrin repeat protein
MLAEKPELVASDSILACAVGDHVALQRAIARDSTWVNLTPSLTCPDCGLPLGRPPLVAVTHSGLGRLEQFRDRLRNCARLLLDAGAGPNQTWNEDDHHSLSALYGAAGKNHDPELTAMLLSAGANPDDGESLYHSVEARDLTCSRLLLEAGAKVEGTNALHHQLDTDSLEGLKLLLAHTKDPNDASSGLGEPLLWAIRRGRSRTHIETLLDAGANPHARNKDGISAYRLALLNGLVDVAAALLHAGASEPLSLEDQFVAACARSDKPEALLILGARPDIYNVLSEAQLRQLPNLTEVGKSDAVRLMVELGWPIAVGGGDWNASALNLAVFRGDAELTRFLLEHGASWTERHGHDDNVKGTLAWASRNHDPHDGDWVGCAKALVEHGLPVLEMDGDYSDEVSAFLAEEQAKAEGSHA